MHSEAQALQRHLLEELLPFWLEHGLDRQHGGFHNRLSLAGEAMPDDHKRLVAQARQIYAYSHAHLLGAPGWALETAGAGLQFLWDRYWDRAAGGWYLTVTPQGEPLDRRKDTYAHAFVLFAMAYYYRASTDSAALEIAELTLDLLDKHLKDPIEHGYFDVASHDWLPDPRLRRQNPHMHLLEAFLALYEATGSARYRDGAAAIVRLLRERLFDGASGTLGEYFEAEWSPKSGAEGEVVEPGHHFEWVWLLHRYGALCEQGAIPVEAGALFDFALAHGVDPESGGVYDELDRSGRVVRGTQRVWPQTEYLQALAARYEAGRSPAARQALLAALERCLAERRPAGPGAWREQLGSDGRLVSDSTPSTTVYHIVLGLTEVARVLERPGSPGVLMST